MFYILFFIFQSYVETHESTACLYSKSLMELTKNVPRFLQPTSLIFTKTFAAILMVMSWASYIVVIYHAAFQEHHISVFILTYFFDFFHIFQLWIIFYNPYLDSKGELVKNPTLIRKR